MAVEDPADVQALRFIPRQLLGGVYGKCCNISTGLFHRKAQKGCPVLQSTSQNILSHAQDPADQLRMLILPRGAQTSQTEAPSTPPAAHHLKLPGTILMSLP